MQPSLNKKNFQAKSSMPELSAEKFKHTRPNIDHLIKRILVERRTEKKKNLAVFIVILLTIFGFIIFFLYN